MAAAAEAVDVATPGGTVEPWADPGRIGLEFEGADRLTTDPSGDLLIETAAGTGVVTRANASGGNQNLNRLLSGGGFNGGGAGGSW